MRKRHWAVILRAGWLFKRGWSQLWLLLFLNDIFGNLRHDASQGHRPYRPSVNLISSHLVFYGVAWLLMAWTGRYITYYCIVLLSSAICIAWMISTNNVAPFDCIILSSSFDIWKGALHEWIARYALIASSASSRWFQQPVRLAWARSVVFVLVFQPTWMVA